ncbi:MAG: hypothetical protein ACLR5G_11950 [Eubacteriales bacterium]
MFLSQKTAKTRRTGIILLVVLAVVMMAMFTVGVFAEGGPEDAPGTGEAVIEEVIVEEEEEPAGMFYATFWALVPPVIAIGLALITKEVYSSLFIGIVVGGLLASSFSPLDTIDSIINNGLIEAVSGSAGIFIFLVILGVLVALINKTGATEAFGRWAKVHIKTRTGAMLATFALGVLIFIDDYFNCLTVGSVMLPVTDSWVSRARLAYLIDATAALSVIAPISSWAAAVSKYAEGTGMNRALHPRDSITTIIR